MQMKPTGEEGEEEIGRRGVDEGGQKYGAAQQEEKAAMEI